MLPTRSARWQTTASRSCSRSGTSASPSSGRRVACPVLVLWATGDDMGDLYGDVLDVWRPWTHDLRGGPVASGHHIAEEAPDVLAAELLAFFEPSARLVF